MLKLKKRIPTIAPKVLKEEIPQKKYNSLDEIVDRNKSFTLIYSGIEGEKYQRWLYDLGVRNFLLSYHYLTVSKINLQKRFEGKKDIRLMVDSGAHTYMQDDSFKEYSIEDWEKLIQKYLKWAEKNREYIFAIVNFDLEALFPNPKIIEEWNMKYFEPFMLRTGIPVCFVWHQNSYRDWDYYCQRYPYVGISAVNALDGETVSLDDLRDKLRIAEKHNALVHGFGMTRVGMLTELPYFSSDSSVSGDSSVLVRSKGRVQRLKIEELYNDLSVKKNCFETSPTERGVDLSLSDYETPTIDEEGKVIWGKLNSVVRHEVDKPMSNFNLEGGFTLSCTDDHSLIYIDNEGSLYEERASAFDKNDYLLSPQSIPIDAPERKIVRVNILPTKAGVRIRKSKKRVAKWVRITDDFLLFLGFWVGNGCFYLKHGKYTGAVGMSGYHYPEVKDVIDRIIDTFEINTTLAPNGVDIVLHSIEFQRILTALGFKGKSHTKRVPSFVYSLSKRQIGVFLKGYFSADGTGNLSCMTVSEELKNDLVELLRFFEIISSATFYKEHTFVKDGVTYNAKKSWRITISDGESRDSFVENIGFLQEYKNKSLDEARDRKSRGSRKRCIPHELTNKDMIRIKHTSKPRGETRQKANSFKGRVGRNLMLEGFSQRLVDTELDFTQILSVSKEKKKSFVYDLSVDKYERFIANGIVVHNTSWKAGVIYGKVAYFDLNTNRLRYLDKDKWKGDYFNELVSRYCLDPKEFENEAEIEIVKASTGAFIEAEKFIRERLKSRMYWLKAVSVKNDADNLSADFFPPLDFFEGDLSGLREYAVKYNVNPDLDTSELVDVIRDVVVFLTWGNPEYERFWRYYANNDSIIIELHNMYINRIVETNEDRVKDLVEFMKEVIEGKTDKLLHMGTNFDRVVKERDVYVEDEIEMEDVSREETIAAVSKYLPESSTSNSEAPEIDELDDEIFKGVGIVPIRDAKGRLQAGVKRGSKKTLYSKKFPKFACDTCYAAVKCPEYKSGYVCAYNKLFNRFDVRNMGDVIQAIQGMVEHNLTRMQKAMVTEILNGSVDPNVTGFINQNTQLLKTLTQLYDSGSAEVLRQTRVMNADGSYATTTEVRNPGSGGILERLFSEVIKNPSKDDPGDEYVGVKNSRYEAKEDDLD